MAKIIRGIFNADFAKAKEQLVTENTIQGGAGGEKPKKKLRGVFNAGWKNNIKEETLKEKKVVPTGDPERSKSIDGITIENKPYKTGTGGKIDVAYDEPMLARNEKLQQLIDKKKNEPNITKDINTEALEVPEFTTGQDNTRVNLADEKGNVNVETPEGTTIPVQTQIPGKPLEEHVSDAAVTFGNAFNSWLNDVYQNTVNPNKEGIPLNPLFDIPFSEQLTKFIPGYRNPREVSTENLPKFIKDFKLKTDYQYGETPPEAPTEFLGHLAGSLVPLMLTSMVGLPPTVSMPLITEPGVQQRLKKGEISEGDANWERAASTLMGALFDIPVSKVLFKEIKDLPVKESTKIGITKAGDVIFKTVGTGMVDAFTQMAQGKVPDMNEVAVNAGTIFVMELLGGHQKIKKMSEKFSDERVMDFVRKFAKGEKLDPEIQAEVEAIHNKPITDVRRLLIGPREHKFEVSPDGKVTEIKRNEPQDMLLSTLEREYGMKPDEIQSARDNLSRNPNVTQEGIAPGNMITDKSKMLPPKREANYRVDEVGNVVPIEYKKPESMLVTQPKESGMGPKEIEKSQRRISKNPNIENGITAVKDPVTDSRIKQMDREFQAAKNKKEAYPVWVEKNKDLYLNENPEVRSKFKAFADKVQEYNRTKSVVEEVPAEVKEKPVIERKSSKERQASQPPTKTEETPSLTKEQKKFFDNSYPGYPEAVAERQHYFKFDREYAKQQYEIYKKTIKGVDEQTLKQVQGDKTLAAGDKVKSRNYRNPEEVLTIVDTRKDNMLKVRDSKGVESLVSKTSVEKVAGSRLQGPRQELEAMAKEVRKARGKKREQLAGDMLKKYDDYKRQYMEETGTEFIPDKKSETGKVLEYLEAKKKISENKGKYGLQSSLLPGGFNPENLPEYVKVGKFHWDNLKSSAKDKAVTFGDWAIKMVDEFSDYIRPHLRTIWTEMKSSEKAKVKSEKESSGSQDPEGVNVPPTKPRPERVNQQSDFGFGDDGKVKSETTKVKNEKDETASLRSQKEPEKGKGWRADELIDEYRALKRRRAQFEEGSEKYEQITKNMERMAKQIETLQDVSRRVKSTERERNTRGRRDMFGEISRKLPEYESRVNERGYTGDDAYEEVRKLIKRDLQTDEAFQVMTAGQKSALIKSLDERFRELNKSRLQIGADLDEPFAETKLRKYIKSGIMQSLTMIEKWGEPGKEFARRMRKFHDRERELMGEPSVIAVDAGNLTAAEYKNFKAIRNAMMQETGLIPEPISENVKKFNDRVNKSYEEKAKLLKARGFETLNPATGEIKPFTPKRDYDPRMLEVTMDKLGINRTVNGEPIYNKLRERQLEYMLESGQAKSKAEASDMLDAYRTQESSKIGKMGNVEYSRVKDIEFAPEMYIQDPMRRYINYMTKVSRRIAHEEQFGMEGGIVNRLMDRMNAEKYDDMFARTLYRYEINDLTTAERRAMEDVNYIKGFQAVTKFSPFTTLRNSLQGVLGSSIRGNLKSALEGFARSMTKEARKNAYLSGALADSIESVVMKDIGGDVNFVTKYLKWIGFTATDRFNRVVGATAGEVFYKDMLKRLKNDSILKKRAIREFDKLGLDAKEIVKRGSFTEQELNMIRRTFAGDTQFNIRPSDLPLWWSSPTGKIVTQWKPFSYKMTQLIRDNVYNEMKKGNVMPTLTLLGAYAVGGEAVNTIIDIVRSFLNFSPREEDKDKGMLGRTAWAKIKEGDRLGLLYRLIDNYSGLGALGFMADIFRTMGYGKSGSTLSGVTSAVLGPTVSTFLTVTSETTGPLLSAIWNREAEWDEAGLKSLRGLFRNVFTNIPGGSIPRTFGFTKYLEKKIFGEDVPLEKLIYAELEKEGVDTDKLKELKDRRKETEKLYLKAKETKDPGDIEAYIKADEELDRLEDESEEYRKYQDKKQQMQTSKDELLGRGKYGLFNELKARGIDIEKIKEIETKERELKQLKEKSDSSRNRDDYRAYKRAEYDLEKLKKRSTEWREYQKLKKQKGEEKKGEFK